MIVLSGADLVLPDRILAPGTLVVDGDRIVDIRAGSVPARADSPFAFHGHSIVPGFIDVHVHGVEGSDTLDGAGAIGAIASRLPKYGVTAFCPTTVACAPASLRHVLDDVRRARAEPDPKAARVLPAHLESNFISPEYAGAQPLDCLRAPRGALLAVGAAASSADREAVRPYDGRRGIGRVEARPPSGEFTADDILREIDRASPDVSIVTVAPELDGGVELVRWLVGRGHVVSLGHSAADYETALGAIAVGARQATHLFNRMPPLGHRAPGLVGAALQADELAAELICDAYHVHPAVMRATIAAKRPARIMAITDGTAVSGLAPGAAGSLGGRPITAGTSAAHLDDGTLAGSILTMDGAFARLIGEVGVSLVDAAVMCATTPARELGLVGHGVLAVGAVADFVVLDARLRVVQTYVGGNLVYTRQPSS